MSLPLCQGQVTSDVISDHVLSDPEQSLVVSQSELLLQPSTLSTEKSATSSSRKQKHSSHSTEAHHHHHQHDHHPVKISAQMNTLFHNSYEVTPAAQIGPLVTDHAPAFFQSNVKLQLPLDMPAPTVNAVEAWAKQHGGVLPAMFGGQRPDPIVPYSKPVSNSALDNRKAALCSCCTFSQCDCDVTDLSLCLDETQVGALTTQYERSSMRFWEDLMHGTNIDLQVHPVYIPKRKEQRAGGDHKTKFHLSVNPDVTDQLYPAAKQPKIATLTTRLQKLQAAFNYDQSLLPFQLVSWQQTFSPALLRLLRHVIGTTLHRLSKPSNPYQMSSKAKSKPEKLHHHHHHDPMALNYLPRSHSGNDVPYEGNSQADVEFPKPLLNTTLKNIPHWKNTESITVRQLRSPCPLCCDEAPIMVCGPCQHAFCLDCIFLFQASSQRNAAMTARAPLSSLHKIDSDTIAAKDASLVYCPACNEALGNNLNDVLRPLLVANHRQYLLNIPTDSSEVDNSESPQNELLHACQETMSLFKTCRQCQITSNMDPAFLPPLQTAVALANVFPPSRDLVNWPETAHLMAPPSAHSLRYLDTNINPLRFYIDSMPALFLLQSITNVKRNDMCAQFQRFILDLTRQSSQQADDLDTWANNITGMKQSSLAQQRAHSCRGVPFVALCNKTFAPRPTLRNITATDAECDALVINLPQHRASQIPPLVGADFDLLLSDNHRDQINHFVLQSDTFDHCDQFILERVLELLDIDYIDSADINTLFRHGSNVPTNSSNQHAAAVMGILAKYSLNGGILNKFLLLQGKVKDLGESSDANNNNNNNNNNHPVRTWSGWLARYKQDVHRRLQTRHNKKQQTQDSNSPPQDTITLTPSASISQHRGPIPSPSNVPLVALRMPFDVIDAILLHQQKTSTQPEQQPQQQQQQQQPSSKSQASAIHSIFTSHITARWRFQWLHPMLLGHSILPHVVLPIITATSRQVHCLLNDPQVHFPALRHIDILSRHPALFNIKYLNYNKNPAPPPSFLFLPTQLTIEPSYSYRMIQTRATSHRSIHYPSHARHDLQSQLVSVLCPDAPLVTSPNALLFAQHATNLKTRLMYGIPQPNIVSVASQCNSFIDPTNFFQDSPNRIAATYYHVPSAISILLPQKQQEQRQLPSEESLASFSLTNPPLIQFPVSHSWLDLLNLLSHELYDEQLISYREQVEAHNEISTMRYLMSLQELSADWSYEEQQQVDEYLYSLKRAKALHSADTNKVQHYGAFTFASATKTQARRSQHSTTHGHGASSIPDATPSQKPAISSAIQPQPFQPQPKPAPVAPSSSGPSVNKEAFPSISNVSKQARKQAQKQKKQNSSTTTTSTTTTSTTSTTPATQQQPRGRWQRHLHVQNPPASWKEL